MTMKIKLKQLLEGVQLTMSIKKPVPLSWRYQYQTRVLATVIL
ncbi:hypothetical protein POPTR_016G023380v4 [Populus trichocarpa]|uniref:glutathione transferase n=1 Tax=Populus trichocarpa TaxID=3694 RepID=A0A2K1X9J5_POPTR|nr:hypothetical protein POPTR_016G023380v4 [Populus trichocarpa]